MKPPTLQLIPLRNAVSSDASTSLDLLVRIIPPTPESTLKRPKLNLGLVIDRSGSMEGQKMEYARQAAKFAVQQLLSTDRVSVTIYDHKVEVLVPSTIVENKAQILRQIQSIEARGSTALHEGWLEGGVQVSQHLQPTQLNRILLLTDGLANIGITNPDQIASDVHGLAENGVSTSTMGIGDDYNEDLMQAMANSGDGNYYYIESPEQLPGIFAAELQGIMATIGCQVSLGIEPLADVTVTEVYNNLTQTEYGGYQLPNLIVGNKIDVVLRLQVPPISKEKPLCQFCLAWNSPDQPGRQELRETLQLPVMAAIYQNELPVNAEIHQLITQLKSARTKEEMIRKLDAGDYQAAKEDLAAARQEVMFAPPSAEMAEELEFLAELELDFEAENYKKLRKRAAYDAYRTHQSRSPNRKTE